MIPNIYDIHNILDINLFISFSTIEIKILSTLLCYLSAAVSVLVDNSSTSAQSLSLATYLFFMTASRFIPNGLKGTYFSFCQNLYPSFYDLKYVFHALFRISDFVAVRSPFKAKYGVVETGILLLDVSRGYDA